MPISTLPCNVTDTRTLRTPGDVPVIQRKNNGSRSISQAPRKPKRALLSSSDSLSGQEASRHGTTHSIQVRLLTELHNKLTTS